MLAIAMATATSYAQTDILFTQHWALPAFYNPARSGETDFLRIGAGARLQWAGISGAPKTFDGSADMPFLIGGKHRIGAGAVVTQESIGLFSNLLTAVQGSYRLKAFKGVLSIGVRAGYYNTTFKGSQIYIPDDDDYHQPNDPNLPDRDVTGNALDLSLGASFSKGGWHGGLSFLHITSPEINLNTEGSENNASKHYATSLPGTLYFEAGGNIKLKNTLFEMQPSLIAASDFKAFSAGISLRGTYNRFISAGIGYRWNDAVSIMAGAEFKDFFVGYSFDYPTSALRKASAGSHELVAGYRLKLNLSGPNRHRHRSIRIM